MERKSESGKDSKNLSSPEISIQKKVLEGLSPVIYNMIVQVNNQIKVSNRFDISVFPTTEADGVRMDIFNQVLYS